MTEPILSTVGLAVGYGKVPVLSGLEIKVDRGEVVALLGPNGAGKTTTLLTIAGELSNLSGDIYYEGSALRGALHKRARRGIALVPESRGVVRRLTAEENLRLGGAPLATALELFPELERLKHRKAGLLSGGEQQMLVLARVLSTRPQILLVDELSSGLAPLVVRRLLAALRSAAGTGCAVILVEQFLQAALSLADRAYVVSGGQLRLEGSAVELLRRREEVEKVYLLNAPEGGGPQKA